MSAADLERFLARVYVDESARARFRADPIGEARRAGLDEEQCRGLADTDWEGLELAAYSFGRKRGHKPPKRGRLDQWLAWLRARLGR